MQRRYRSDRRDTRECDGLGSEVAGGGATGALYDLNTDFTGTGFDPVAAGWTLVPVPEPGTALLMGLGLTGLAGVRRR